MLFRSCVRPIRPTDAAAHLAFLRQLDAQDIRMRLFYSKRALLPEELDRQVTISHDRDMAFLAMAVNAQGEAETPGMYRAMLGLAQSLGFTATASQDGVMELVLPLAVCRT